MAAGDITYDSSPVASAGDHYIVTGLIEADTTERAFQLVNDQQALIYCNLICTTTPATTDVRANINLAANFSTSTSGSLAVDAEAADTFRFTAGYR